MRARRPETIKNHARNPENDQRCAPAGRDDHNPKNRPCLKRVENAGTMATIHTRLIQYLTKLGGGPAPWAPANLAGTAALFGASAVCAGAYTLWGSSGVPGTHKSSLWQEATNAYLKFQGADPISYPEVGKPKF